MEEENENLDNGIHPQYESLYIECILSATESASSSLVEIDEILLDTKLLQAIGLKIINLSENIVSQAGVISKYFDPPNAKKIHKLRADKLRNIYKIEDDNVLLNRGFRNHIEHFDEKLDLYLKKPIIGEVVPAIIVYTIKEINSITNVFKGFVIDESKLISLGKVIEIVPLMKEIYRIHDLCIEFIKK